MYVARVLMFFNQIKGRKNVSLQLNVPSMDIFYRGLHTFLSEIVETTFVISHFSDIRKETTSFLVIPKRNDQERQSYSVVSARNDQKQQ